MVGGSGGDLLRGGSGAERIEARDGFADVISCGAGSEDLVLADALDSVAADCESPVVSQAKPGCGSRNYVGPVPAGQTLYGTSCSDIIKGGGGNDTLWGLPSGDDLDGGRGANDVCNGGKGNDDFSRCDGNAHE